MRPAHLLWLAACSLPVVGACVFERAASFPTSPVGSSSAPRKPDGVAVDLEGSLPDALLKGSTELTLVPLQEPANVDHAVQVVRKFFRAVSREDLPDMVSTFGSEASIGPLRSAGGGPAEELWERRIRRLDYLALGPEQVFDESLIEIYRHADFDNPLPGRPSRPAAMAEQDVLVRVPIRVNRVGTQRLFGDEIRFVLRPSEGAFRIIALLEDFQPP